MNKYIHDLYERYSITLFIDEFKNDWERCSFEHSNERRFSKDLDRIWKDHADKSWRKNITAENITVYSTAISINWGLKFYVMLYIFLLKDRKYTTKTDKKTAMNVIWRLVLCFSDYVKDSFSPKIILHRSLAPGIITPIISRFFFVS